MVNSFYDPELEQGCAFEELISFHGGLGGPQTQPFILHPVDLPAPAEPIRGAAAVHDVLMGWRRMLEGAPALGPAPPPIDVGASLRSVSVGPCPPRRRGPTMAAEGGRVRWPPEGPLHAAAAVPRPERAYRGPRAWPAESAGERPPAGWPPAVAVTSAGRSYRVPRMRAFCCANSSSVRMPCSCSLPSS